jgi:MoaA/NifB/PqqE/SkfB family radical SAM enzyme
MINDLPYKLRSTHAFSPHTIFVIINSVCNAKCMMCDIGQANRRSQFYQIMNRGTELDIETFKKFVEDVRGFKPEIAITSTEPLLYRDIVQAVKVVKDAGMRCTVTTNGLLLPKYAKKLCAAGLDTLQVSIDGTAEVHDHIRGIPGLFAKATEGLNIVKSCEPRPKILINTTITPLNQHDLYNVAAYFDDFGVDFHTFSHMNFVTREMKEEHNKILGRILPATESSVAIIDPAKIDVTLLHGQLVKIKQEFRRVGFTPPIFSEKELTTFYRTGDFLKGYDACKLPWQVSQITADGDVVVATRCYNVSFGNIKEKSFSEIWNGPKMREFRRHLLKHKAFPACSRCCGIF